MRIALINPPWSFEGSVYFGCREPHFPLELGYARALLEAAGHEAELVDAHARGLDLGSLRRELEALAPDISVITTAPSYLFWRCAPPELRVPMATAAALRGVCGELVAVGPHGSTSPGATLRKLDASAVILGECEEVLVRLADTPLDAWGDVPSVRAAHGPSSPSDLGAADLSALPALRWSEAEILHHPHHHHRFEAPPIGLGAEIEASRGCPYHCTFCAKERFRDKFRRRPLTLVLDELDALLAQGVRYVYFIDEIFLPDIPLLDELVKRDVAFGVQMRIDNWSLADLDRLGAAGCVSIEAGVESIREEGRALLAKRCRLTTEELTERLIHARKRVPFVQANLLHVGRDSAFAGPSLHVGRDSAFAGPSVATETDDPAAVEAWRERLQRHGVWANAPVPLFPYPGSPEYTRRWGLPDDRAWERAHEDYLTRHRAFSDIQDTHPLPLLELEHAL